MKYVVYVDRVERIGFCLNVEAESKEEAMRIVKEADERNKFENIYNELCPNVDTDLTVDTEANQCAFEMEDYK